MTDIFGFDPRDLRSRDYHTWGKEKAHRYTLKKDPGGGMGIFTWYPEEVPDIIRKVVDPDIRVEGRDNPWLRYCHRHTGNRDVYFLVNGHDVPDTLLVSLRNTGIPWLWHPETGEIRQLTNVRVSDGRLEVMLDFAPWEAFYLVVEPGETNHG